MSRIKYYLGYYTSEWDLRLWQFAQFNLRRENSNQLQIKMRFHEMNQKNKR